MWIADMAINMHVDKHRHIMLYVSFAHNSNGRRLGHRLSDMLPKHHLRRRC